MTNVCWHDDGRMRRGHDCHTGQDRMVFLYGRCRSGSRWFWGISGYAIFGDDNIAEHGWSPDEVTAIRDARDAVTKAAGGRPALAYPRHGVAARILREVNAARRAARPPSGETSTAAVEFLYVPSHYNNSYTGETRRWVQGVPIAKKTAKRIYYQDDRGHPGDIIKLRYIDRAKFERDGKIRIPDASYYLHGHMFFATEPAAEADLYTWNARPVPKVAIKDLWQAMVDAHPDKGGTDEQFIAARERYELAKVSA